jgi:transketolase
MKKGPEELETLAQKIRVQILNMIYQTRGPHLGSSFSCIELLVALYFHTLKTTPEDWHNPKRDRFIFSKGHASPGFYAALYQRGFISQEDMLGFAINGGVLQQHPDCDLQRGIEVSTGSLGHGLSIGSGMAYALKKDGNPARVFVMISDGELNEGSTWEAVLFAAHHKLDNLTLLVDYNHMGALGFTRDTLDLDPLAKKFSAFNWAAETIDGHSFSEILSTFDRLPLLSGFPSAVVAETVKGKGVSFMENQLNWHYCCPNEEQYAQARKELGS